MFKKMQGGSGQMTDAILIILNHQRGSDFVGRFFRTFRCFSCSGAKKKTGKRNLRHVEGGGFR